MTTYAYVSSRPSDTGAMSRDSLHRCPGTSFISGLVSGSRGWVWRDHPDGITAADRPTEFVHRGGSRDEAARRRGEAAGRSRWGALAFRDVSYRFDAEDAPGVLAKLTGYELWERTQRAGQQLATAYERTIGARSEQERVAVALEFLRRMRQLLALRLVAGAGGPRPAFPPGGPPAGGPRVPAAWGGGVWGGRGP